MRRRSLIRAAWRRGAAAAVLLALLAGMASAQTAEGIAAYQRGDFATALRVLNAAATAGQTESGYWLGRMYEYGLGVPADPRRALAFYQAAAERGHPPSQHRLAAAHATGDLAPVDLASSYRWASLSAAANYAPGQIHVAEMLSLGSGVPRDPVEAYKWYVLARAHGGVAALLAQNQLDRFRGQMSAGQVRDAEARAAAWRPTGAVMAGAAVPAVPPPALPPAPPPAAAGGGQMLSQILTGQSTPAPQPPPLAPVAAAPPRPAAPPPPARPPASAVVGGPVVGGPVVGGPVVGGPVVGGPVIGGPIAGGPPGAPAGGVIGGPVPPAAAGGVFAAPTAPAAPAVAAAVPGAPAGAQEPITVGGMLRSVPCSNLYQEAAQGGGIRIAGGAPARELTNLRSRMDRFAASERIEWAVLGFDGPFCPILDTLGDLLRRNQIEGLGLAVAAANRPTARYVPGENLLVRVRMPAFDSFVYVAFVTHDGDVVHMLPNRAERANRRPARASFDLGDPALGGREWKISPPYGTEMVIAVASAQPLFDDLRPDAENISAYAAALRAGLDRLARRQGVQAAASALFLTIEPR